MLYFAYGSNMNWDDLDKWCESKGYNCLHPGTWVEKGVINGYRLEFNHYSYSRNGGALNIVKYSNEKVCGVLFDLSEEDFKKVEEKEGSKYEIKSVNVYLSDTEEIKGAKTFRVKDTRKHYSPSSEYLDVVLAGADYFNLEEECIAQIKKAAERARSHG